MRMLIPIAAPLAVLMSITLAHGSGCAPPPTLAKRDILGVSTGMTIGEAFQILEKQGWQCDARENATTRQCGSTDVGMTFRTVVASRNGESQIIQLTYRFRHQDFSQLESDLRTTYKLTSTPSGFVLPSGEHMYINATRISILDPRLEQLERAKLTGTSKPKF